jgi:hypothetical protein
MRAAVSCCEICSWPITLNRNGRPRVYCSEACRAKAYRNRVRSVTKLFPTIAPAVTVGLSVKSGPSDSVGSGECDATERVRAMPRQRDHCPSEGSPLNSFKEKP